jgi:acyl-CoA synthetase (AMP-forming)/AMP-acid ligase II
MIIVDFLYVASVRYPDRACISGDSGSLTFPEASTRADRLAAALAGAGLQHGDRSAMLAENEMQFFEAQSAAMRTGFVFVPLNYRLNREELAFPIANAEPKVLIVGQGFSNTAALLDVPIKWHLDDDQQPSYEAVLASADPSTTGYVANSTDPCVIHYTSGTTGHPKGVVISNGALAMRLHTYAFESGIRPGDVLLQPMAQFHVGSHVSQSFANCGNSVVFLRRFDPSDVLRAIEEYRCTHVSLAPTMMVINDPTLADRDISSLRLVNYGASSIAPTILRQAMERLGCGFRQSYGMTETGPAATLEAALHDAEDVRVLGSEGRSVCRRSSDCSTTREPRSRSERPVRSSRSLRATWKATSASRS